MTARSGLVVMAYGTPATASDIEAYYTHIRRGRAPEPAQLEELAARYAAIGGTSPLAARTEAQRQALAAGLHARQPGRWSVVLGQKHAAPFIEEAVATLAASGVEEVVGLVLAPHYSKASVGEYQARLAEAAGGAGLRSVAIDHWHLEPSYVSFLASAVRDGLAELPAATRVVFTAHSLPERVLVDDPYPEQLAASASATATALGLADHRWSLGWQSAGRTPDPWRGPDILAVLEELAADPAVEAVLVCPQGFVSDHLEVVYDLDIEAARHADRLGLTFARTRVLNDHAPVLEALADRVVALVP